MVGTPSRVQIRLLGRFELQLDGRTVIDAAWPRKREQALVKLLALQPQRSLHREQVLAALWPQLTEAAAGRNLRKLRLVLSRALEEAGVSDGVVSLSGETLALAPTIEVDIDAFRAAARGARAARTDAALYERALDLYKGDLLPDDLVEEWTEAARGDLRAVRQLLLMELAQLLETQGALNGAAERLQELVTADPLNEDAHRWLMRVYAQAGRRERAQQQYNLLRETLQRELGAEPDEATQLLHTQIRAGRAPRAPSSAVASSATFVGREPEIAELRTAVDAVAGGRGQIVLLAGEPGIGKTALAQELTLYGRLRQARVVWGRCYEDETLPAFGPWVQVLRSCAPIHRPAAPDQLSAFLGDRVGGSGAEPELLYQPEGLNHRVLAAVTDFLKSAALRQPLMILLDDLQWADRDSLLLLRFLARETRDVPLFIVGTYRDADAEPPHPLAEIASGLAREPHCRILLLRGLDESAVRALVERAVGESAPDHFVSSILKRTQGNPLYLTESLRLLGSQRTWDLPLPTRVQEVIRQRLDKLSAGCRRLVSIAAVIGQEFDLPVIERVGEMHRADLLDVLDEATQARVCEEVSDAVGRFAFAHPLIRETLYEGLARTERTGLHRRIGEALESVDGGDSDEHVAELAHHFYLAAAAGDAERAITYMERAGDRAFAVGAYEDAAHLYDRSLQVLETQLPVERERRAGLRIALGRTLWRGSNSPDAATHFRGALDDARAVGDPALYARAVHAVSTGHGATAVDENLITLAEDALSGLGEAHPELRCLLLGQIAKRLEAAPTVALREKAAAAGRAAIALARRIGSDIQLANALWNWHDAVSGPDNLEERLTAMDEMIRCATRLGDDIWVRNGRTRRLAALLEVGDILEFDLELSKVEALNARLRLAQHERWTFLARTARALLTGAFEEAERLAQQALALGQQIGDPDVLAMFGGQLLQLRWDQGRLEELEAPIQDLLKSNPGFVPLRASLAHIYAELGRRAEARAEFGVFAGAGLATMPRNRVWVVTMLQLSQVCAFLGDRKRATELYDLLIPFADRCGVVSFGYVCTGSNHRVLGLLASTLERFEDAQQHFEKALAANERLGARPYLARTQVDYARMLLQRNDRGDSDRASDLLSQALEPATALGMLRVAEEAEVLAAAAHAGAQSVPPPVER